MDNAEHLYGRRETWARLYQSDTPGTPKNCHRLEDPLQLMLQYIDYLEGEYKELFRQSERLEHKIAVAETVYEMWLARALKEGTYVLREWRHPQIPPHAEYIPLRLRRRLEEQQRCEAEGLPLPRGYGATLRRELETRTPADAPVPPDGPEQEDQLSGNLPHDPLLGAALAREVPPEPSEMPFLRRRVISSPDSLHPALARWTERWYPEGDDGIKPLAGAAAPGVSRREETPYDASLEDPPRSSSRGRGKDGELRKQLVGRRVEKRPPVAKTLHELRSRTPTFDATHTYRQKGARDAHSSATAVRVDWDTLRQSQGDSSYDRKRAQERKIRLQRGEDV